MGTRILTDIQNDLKQLITAITSFEENEEGFRVCEKFCTTSIKHHRYLSVNSNTTKEAIKGIITKLSIHGKYAVSKKLDELVNTFLSSFDFEQHPQYDLQWYLLTLLLELSKETHKSSLDCLKLSRGECTFNVSGGSENDITDEIDWAEYLKEGQENFFSDYKSDSDSEWSDSTEEDVTDLGTRLFVDTAVSHKVVCIAPKQNAFDKLSLAMAEGLNSRNWLLSHVQNTWWNELEWQRYPVKSRFCDARLGEIWHKESKTDFHTLGTLSEYQACRELLWMFHVQAQMVVFQKNDNSDFSIRSSISIPSLTTVAFNSILSSFCSYFSMIKDIEEFGIALYSKQDHFHKKPPLTYEAYNAALNQQLNNFKNEIINIEKNLMKQDGINTFLSLSSTFKQKLSVVKILHEVHRNVVYDWRVSSNWECASKLLSNLYLQMKKSHSRDRTNICASLYLSSLSVYLNIIDTWLSEGRFEDWREEFIIARSCNSRLSENNEQYEAFSVRSLDDICIADPIMQSLIKNVQLMGQSIELLVSLDRITDIWKINTGQNETRGTLINEFYDRLNVEISKYSTCELQEEACPSVSETDSILRNVYDKDVEKNIIQQLSEFNNPFLLKAVEDYIPLELIKKNDTVDGCVFIAQSTETQIFNLFERLGKTSQYILPFRKILENTLSDILGTRYNNASKLVKNIMIEEYKLESHLTLMRCVYMMEAGHIISKFYQILFQEIESNHMWSNSYFLSCVLEEILSQQWPDTSSRWSITVSNTNTHQVLVAADHITLHYTVGWPINILLNEETFKKYNEIFRFQLKLKWALWTLNNLRFNDLEGSKSTYKRNRLEQSHIRRIENLRFWLLHAIGSIHAYLSGQVLQNLGIILEKALKQADTFDVIISVHNEYLRKVHEHCLLTTEFEDLMATINNLIEMCNHVRNRWNDKKLMFATEELNILEQSYIKYHTYLALALHNAVQNKDANYYELMPQYQASSESIFEECTVLQSINNLSRSLLTEVAYQYLPPSGLAIPIPRMIHRMDWYRSGFTSDYPLPNEVSLNEYEQTFSYIRWYLREEQFVMFNSSPYFLRQEMQDFVNVVNNSEVSL